MTEPFTIVGYYTDRYAENADEFRSTCDLVGVECYCKHVEDRGSWLLNTSYKPTFIRECLETIDKNIAYCDVDARLLRYPELFGNIEEDIAYWRCNIKTQRHLASGTLFFQNNDISMSIVELWEKVCAELPNVNDQTVLESVIKEIKHSEFALPMEYCQIFDWPKQSEKPVIIHLQESRRLKT